MQQLDPNKSSIWTAESYQERRRWELIEEWNERSNFFGPDDVIGFGDTDEIASRLNVYKLRHCKMLTDELCRGDNSRRRPSSRPCAVDVGIWFPFGRLDQAFRTDHPVPGNRYTLGDPTYFTFAGAKEYSRRGVNDFPTRMRGRSRYSLLGGVHLTHYNYLPYHLVKVVGMSEGSFSLDEGRVLVGKVVKMWEEDKLQELEDAYFEFVLTNPPWIGRFVKIDHPSVQRELAPVVHVPWFYKCNRGRYPRWEGKPDSRLGLSEPGPKPDPSVLSGWSRTFMGQIESFRVGW